MAGNGRADCAISDKFTIERLTEYEASAKATSVLVGAFVCGCVDAQAESTRKEAAIVTIFIFMTVIFSLIFTSYVWLRESCHK